MASTPTDELDRRLHQFEDEFAALALQDALRIGSVADAQGSVAER